MSAPIKSQASTLPVASARDNIDKKDTCHSTPETSLFTATCTRLIPPLWNLVGSHLPFSEEKHGLSQVSRETNQGVWANGREREVQTLFNSLPAKLAFLKTTITFRILANKQNPHSPTKILQKIMELPEEQAKYFAKYGEGVLIWYPEQSRDEPPTEKHLQLIQELASVGIFLDKNTFYLSRAGQHYKGEWEKGQPHGEGQFSLVSKPTQEAIDKAGTFMTKIVDNIHWYINGFQSEYLKITTPTVEGTKSRFNEFFNDLTGYNCTLQANDGACFVGVFQRRKPKIDNGHPRVFHYTVDGQFNFKDGRKIKGGVFLDWYERTLTFVATEHEAGKEPFNYKFPSFIQNSTWYEKSKFQWPELRK